jgi:hypothetical protein
MMGRNDRWLYKCPDCGYTELVKLENPTIPKCPTKGHRLMSVIAAWATWNKRHAS